MAFQDVEPFLVGAYPDLPVPWEVPLVAFLVLVVPSCEEVFLVVAFPAFLAFPVEAFPASYS